MWGIGICGVVFILAKVLVRMFCFDERGVCFWLFDYSLFCDAVEGNNDAHRAVNQMIL